jgi:hypothetical protein
LSARRQQYPVRSRLERDLQEAGTDCHAKLEVTYRSSSVLHVTLAYRLQLLVDTEADRIHTGQFRKCCGRSQIYISAPRHLAESQ